MSGRAGLVGAVNDAEAEVLVGAVAGDVALGAPELRVGDGDHVADTGLLLHLISRGPLSDVCVVHGALGGADHTWKPLDVTPRVDEAAQGMRRGG